MAPATARNVGIGLVGVGIVLVIVGLLALGAGDGGDASVAATTTTPARSTTQPSSPSTSGAAPTEAPAPTPPAPTAATTAPPSATTTIAPTTTVAPEALIESFIAAYAAATEGDDVEFLYNSLHPGVIDVGGEDLCRTFVAREIIEISDYELTGDVTGPSEIIPGIMGYRAAISFRFQGQTFSDDAQFAIVDGAVRWFTSCR